MSLLVHVGHSGQTLQVSTSDTPTLDALKTELHSRFHIPPAKQVFLTPSGKSVRVQTYSSEPVIFVFDSTLFSSPSDTDFDPRVLARQPTAAAAAATRIGNAPDTIANQTDLASWQTLFRKRSDWAVRLQELSVQVAGRAAAHAAEHANIHTGLQAALASLKGHIRSAEQRLAAVEAWSSSLFSEQTPRLDRLVGDLKILAQIPAKPEFAPFLLVPPPVLPATGAKISLVSFLEEDRIASAASLVRTLVKTSSSRVHEVRETLSPIVADYTVLSDNVAALPAGPQDYPQNQIRIREEIDVLMDKLRSDKEYVDSLSPSATHSAPRASKTALTHTKIFLPRLKSYHSDMCDVADSVLEQRDHLARDALQYMRVIAKIQSQLSRAYGTLKLLESSPSPEEQVALRRLNLVARLPFGYGAWMVETIRRQRQSPRVADDVLSKDERQRRKQWLTSVDDIIDPTAMDTLTVPVSAESRLVIAPDDLGAYISVLGRFGFPAAMIQELADAADELGQIAAAAAATSQRQQQQSVTPPQSRTHVDEPDVTSLQTENSKLQDELRAQRSRVRKLEDLLHRQTAAPPVLVSPDVFVPRLELVSSPQTPPTTSQTPPSASRSAASQHAVHSSARISQDLTGQISDRPRRPSSRLQNEDRLPIERRLVTLEGELETARQKILGLEREAVASGESLRKVETQLTEAQSTKLDIMQNMEAQQREFATVRRNLELDLDQARSRVEDVEDELDRLVGSGGGGGGREHSHDNRRPSRDHADGNVGLERLRAEMQTTIDARDREIENVNARCEAEIERSRAHANIIESLTAAKSVLQSRLDQARFSVRERDEAQEEQALGLTAAHRTLSPEGVVPVKYGDLVAAIEGLAVRAASHSQELAEAVSRAEAENEALRSRERSVQTLACELAELRSQRDVMRDELSRAREECETLRRGRTESSEQLSEGQVEPPPDTHELRVEDSQPHMELVRAKSHADTLEAHVERLQGHLDEAKRALVETNERLDGRAIRANDVSQRLYLQHTRLLRLLDTLGFVTSYRDGVMVIERAPRIGGSSTMTASEMDPDADPDPGPGPGPASGSGLGSGTGPAPDGDTQRGTGSPSVSLPTRDAKTGRQSCVQWADVPGPAEEEIAFETFLTAISLFSTKTFCEAIAKRVRDFEYTARKWQREARTYREKCIRAQKEARSKIAVRDFKEGDLALFLPTVKGSGRAGKAGAWAAFNINAPHHFLFERESMALGRREWLVARVTRVEERTVGVGGASGGGDARPKGDGKNSNPFGLSEGLTWYLVHATEDKIGAPTTPGLGKSTVAAANVDARGSSVPIDRGRRALPDASSTLNKIGSLESRRSSTHSRVGTSVATGGKGGSASTATTAATAAAAPTDGPGAEQTHEDTENGDGRSRSPHKSLREANSGPTDVDPTGRVRVRDQAGVASSARPTSSAADADGDDGVGDDTGVTADATAAAATAASAGDPKDETDVQSKRASRPRSRVGGWQSLWSLDYEL